MTGSAGSTPDLEQQVAVAVATMAGIQVGEVSPDSILGDDLELDSIGVVELVAELRSTLRVGLEAEAVSGSMSVREVTEMVATRLLAGGSPALQRRTN
jgi:acyl carrier protein